MTTATTDMAALFAGHPGAYFSQHPSPRCVRQPVTLGLINDHLRGLIEIGTYPVRPNGTCRWGCIDLDGADDTEQYAKARTIQAAWTYLGVVSWIERSRSKGFHVWVFSSTWVSARTMRYAGLYVNELSEVRSPEVNPKSDTPWRTSNGLINCVRVPYSGSRNPGRMAVLDEDGDELTVEEFSRRAMRTRNDPDILVGIADRWRIHLERASPPLRKQLRTEQDHTGQDLILPSTSLVTSTGKPKSECCKYMQKVFRSIRSRVSDAAEGSRNDTLNREAFLAGGYVASGSLSPEWCRDGLLRAVAAAPKPLPSGEASRLIDRALREATSRPVACKRCSSKN